MGSVAPTGAGGSEHAERGAGWGFAIRQIAAVEYTALEVRRLEVLVTEVGV